MNKVFQIGLLMAFSLACRVTIEGLKPIDYLCQASIESGYDEIADRCTIQLPNFKGQSEKLISPGKRISVELGYNGQLRPEFSGFVAATSPKIPFELKCEGELYGLQKQPVISKTYQKIKLKDLLLELVPGVILAKDLPDVNLENFQVNRATPAQVLQELKEKYGLSVYYRGSTLYVGLPFTAEPGLFLNPVRYHFQKNVVSDSDLTYLRASDIKLKIKAVSILKNNSKIEAEIGDSDGEQRTLYYYNIENVFELEKLAKADIGRYKYEGYRGSLLAFGLPFVQHSQVVELVDERYPERPQGRYLVKSVKVDFGYSGFRRSVELGNKV